MISEPNNKILKTYICGCVRNCESNLIAVFANIAKITELFDDYRIIIAYDESSDKSLKILCDMKKQFPKMDILINKNTMEKERTHNIANARNSLLQSMRDHQSISNTIFDYFIMLDMDDICAGPINIDVLQKCINYEKMDHINMSNIPKWDTLSFNRPGYYDIWALSIDNYVFSCWHFTNGRAVISEMRNYIIDKLAQLKIKNDQNGENELLQCMSAFNGFAIYRISTFLNVEQDGRVSPLVINSSPNQPYLKYEWNVQKNIEIIPSQLITNMSKVVNQPLSSYTPWQTKEDCEHRYFHIRATQLNGARICISPEILFTDFKTA